MAVIAAKLRISAVKQALRLRSDDL